ncbi:Flp pilus assembly protein CpaB [Amaricoccus sp.]|uniref:Flp pilus assembly protein CpaB n=1 Tax=Amaricoccus sp. TaxID=1872485 RepID=UPI001B667061|nr:Flp pilus assembly protein CpaB [Amaricoccus sp.]MBP6999920.1 Flp pilus assembly protein CpaB [Amaricoccus sp.]
MRVVVLLATGLIAAGGAGLYLYRGMEPAPAEAAAAVVEPPRQAEVYVAKVDLARGAILKPEHLGRMPIGDAALTPEMAPAGPEGDAALLGAVALQPLPAGVPIARSSVVQPGDRGFLAAVLPQGKRAISIPISEVAGLSGLVLPGDRVDIILTYSLAGDTIDAGRDVRASETVLENIRVLALDQRLGQSAPKGDALADAPPIARTATLQVTPHEAEMITLATSLGDLSMVLNSVHDGGEEAEAATEAASESGAEAPRRMTLDSEVTSLLRREAPEESGAAPTLADRTLRIQIVRGAKAGAIELGQEVVASAGPAPEVPPDDAGESPAE